MVLVHCSSKKKRTGIADFCVATDGYFQVLGIPLIRGRIFDERDGANSPHVCRDQRIACARPVGQIRTPSATPLSLETWMATCAC